MGQSARKRLQPLSHLLIHNHRRNMQPYIKLITAVLLSVCMHSVSAQYYSYSQLTKAADAAYEQAHFIKAIDYYQQAKEINKDYDSDLLFKLGDAAFQVNSLPLAKATIEEYLSRDDIPLAHNAIFKLGRIAQLTGNYEDALRQYDLYLSEYNEVDAQTTSNIEFLRSSANWALTSDVENAIDTVMRLGDEINSPYSENAPYYQDGQLYYSSLRFPIEKDKYQRSKSQMLKETEVMSIPSVEESQLVSNLTFTADGTQAYFTICDYVDIYSVHCKIHKADVTTDGLLANVVALPESINAIGYTTTHPTIAETIDGNYLYFATNKAGGKGGLDIWKSKIEDGTYSIPNVASHINTSGDDLSPFYHNETNTLYFSSNGRDGYGGHDIFKLEPASDTPINAGDNINSSYNDIHFTLTEDGSSGYFTSNRPGSRYSDDSYETCCYDIYKAKVKPSLLTSTRYLVLGLILNLAVCKSELNIGTVSIVLRLVT